MDQCLAIEAATLITLAHMIEEMVYPFERGQRTRAPGLIHQGVGE
jgi:hypothetical protein